MYVVLWFGRRGTPIPPSERRPRNADELRNHLVRDLNDSGHDKITVIVMDVSRSNTPTERIER